MPDITQSCVCARGTQCAGCLSQVFTLLFLFKRKEHPNPVVKFSEMEHPTMDSSFDVDASLLDRDVETMRQQWAYVLSYSILGSLLFAQGFLQTSLLQGRTRLVGTNLNPLDVGSALSGPHLLCSVPAKASVDVPPVSAAAQRAGGEDDDSLLFPFRHKSTVFIEMTDM